jgi:hypothetical protein
VQDPPPEAHRSPDGRYWWDGRQWLPVSPPQPPGRKSASLPVPAIVALALIGVVVLVGGGLAGFLVLNRLGTNSTASAPSSERTPLSPTFDMPPGFVHNQNYQLIVPLYDNRTTQWIVPNSRTSGLDVIFVVSYVADQDASRQSDDQIRSRMAGYDVKVSATKATTPMVTQIDSHRAWTQHLEQPVPGGGTAVYDTTYVFAGSYLVQVGCQWQEQQALIASACRTVLASLQVHDK